VRAFYVPDLYFRSEAKVRGYLAANAIVSGLASGTHADLADTSELMYVDRNRKWVRRDQLPRASADTGVDGDPRGATPALGKRFIGYKIDSAVAQIRRLIAEAQ
jgi:creatinine amidohydrolase/Fe(II)-dependent formamide hydrolase-like protein